jgi:hypothetical protein
MRGNDRKSTATQQCVMQEMQVNVSGACLPDPRLMVERLLTCGVEVVDMRWVLREVDTYETTNTTLSAQ